MKFSILLPTRNRLDLLKYAIRSVLDQSESDWEIIVSDNASEEDISGYIQSLNDPRVKYFRTDSFISITDNWNRALDKSSGEWIIMLGDDDCLMKGYFSTINELIEKFPNPELIYSNAFQYAYPNTLPDCPHGRLLIWNNAIFLSGQSSPFWLTKKESSECVQKTFNFEVVFNFNMQFATVHRSLIEKLKYQGSFFYSTYPDYYAMTAMMLHANRILVCPRPLVSVGIAPKSYGFYYFNDLEDLGVSKLLNNRKERKQFPELEQIILPGTDMNTCWLVSLLSIKNNFNLSQLKPNYKRYRFLQVIQSYKRWLLKGWKGNMTDILSIWKKLNRLEIFLYALPLYIAIALIRFLPLQLRLKFANRLERLQKVHPPLYSEILSDKFENILQVFEKFEPQKDDFKNNDKNREPKDLPIS
jgi:glycosyltransferase involved in cell wall biosynthesis